ncbi:MAG: hypothetical protein ABI442_17255 [Gemmatimonadaceae bacterium]
MKRVLLLVSTAVVMSACGQSVTAPAASNKTPSARPSHDDIFCESGYVIAYDENGNPICVPDSRGESDFHSSLPRGGNSSSGTNGMGTPPGGL